MYKTEDEPKDKLWTLGGNCCVNVSSSAVRKALCIVGCRSWGGCARVEAAGTGNPCAFLFILLLTQLLWRNRIFSKAHSTWLRNPCRVPLPGYPLPSLFFLYFAKHIRCYGLSCVSSTPKLICWGHNPQYFWMWLFGDRVCKELIKLKWDCTSLVVQWLTICDYNAGGGSSIPGQGTKIPTCCVAQPEKKKKS